MTDELEMTLVAKYPKLFKNYKGDPMATCMAWGMECCDGWYKILDHLFGYLTDTMERKFAIEYTQEYQDKHKNNKDFYTNFCSHKILPPQIVLDQVKEKYGTLRVYYSLNTEEIPEELWAILDHQDYNKKIERYYNVIDNAIDYAEYQSGVTCEVTGKDGKLYTKGWHKVLCDEEAIATGRDPKDGEKIKYINV
jgi:hypothetical protein